MFFPHGINWLPCIDNAHALLREMKDAELALGQVPSEANFAWLKDVKARLEEVDGTEALIEGFGELSGRFQRSM